MIQDASPIVPAAAPRAIPLHRAPLDLGALLRSALASLQSQAEGLDIKLALEVAPPLPAVTADADKIAWAVTSLVGNALRYVRRGSRLRPGGTIEVAVRQDGTTIAIIVEDDGPGIPAEMVPFLLTRPNGAQHATGLALSLVNEIALAHGGTFDIRSRTGGPDHGTRVKLSLPVVQG
jgi:signal transduction histidine kinase